MNRRQFIARAASMTALPYTHLIAGHSPALAIIDGHLPFSRDFAQACAGCGIDVRPLREDMAETWYREIAPVLPSASVLGMTPPAEFQVFSLLAHEHHASSRYYGLHCHLHGILTHQIRSSCEIEACVCSGADRDWATQAIQIMRASNRKSIPIPLAALLPDLPGCSFTTWVLA